MYHTGKALGLALSLFMAATNATAEQCDISGNVELWAKDACFWINETDETSAPSMAACLAQAQRHIVLLGDCDAKHLFKNAICAQASNWQLNDDCLTSNIALGPALSEQLYPQ